MYIQDLKPLVPLGPLGTMKETIEALGNYIIHTIDVQSYIVMVLYTTNTQTHNSTRGELVMIAKSAGRRNLSCKRLCTQ